jgi:hypothetical protein
MPITPFLAPQAFDPEVIEEMSAAFVAACDALHLKVVDDPATRLVAEKIASVPFLVSQITTGAIKGEATLTPQQAKAV